MHIAILNVGDAAACFLEDDDVTPRVLLDGGRVGNARDLEWFLTTKGLRQRTTPSVHNLEALVASHFDIDHWGGLAALGNRNQATGHAKRLDIYFPRMPEIATEVPVAMLYLRTLTGEHPAPYKAASLAGEWQPGRQVTLHALRQGDSVVLAGTPFDVLWPPQQLPKGRAKSLRDALNKVKEHAQSNPLFGDLWDRLHDQPFGASDPVDKPLSDDSSAEPSAAETLDAESFDFDDDLDDDHENFYDLPEALIDAAKVVHGWNNHLSLVLGARDKSFLALGDLKSQWAIKNALGEKPSTYTYMLAPHHGTHGSKGLPDATECFMQTGHGHAQRTAAHLGAHSHARHVCTHTGQKRGKDVGTPCPEIGCTGSLGGFFRR